MKDYSDMTHAELVERLRMLESGQVAKEREELIHNLEVHQAELESQNQQLRETQALLEESRARYADLYDFAPVAYCTFDKNGCIVEINLTGAVLLGMERSKLLGKPFILFVSQPDKRAFLKHLSNCFAKSDEASTDLTLTLKTKNPVVVQMVSTQALDGTRHTVGCRAALTDVSDRKQGEEALRLAVRMREDFLAIVSHDLRNPLSSVLLGTQWLLRTSPEADEQSRHVLQLMHRAAERMNRLLGDLLDLSSMDAGHLSMHRGIHDVADLVASVMETMEPMATKKALRLEAKIEGTPLFAYCDRDRIIQVLLNLVGNAIKFTPEAGLIRVEATPQAGGLVLAVRDTGSGIASPQLAHVFDPYWQAEKSARKGTGLGLSIAKGIVEFHGGRIWAESQLDRGSTFFFTLPSKSPTPDKEGRIEAQSPGSPPTPLLGARPQPTAPDHPSPSPPPRLILIVDNDEDTRDSLAGILSAEGYEVATAANGYEALKYLQQVQSKPFLILLDIDMPGMDGGQFLAHRSQDAALAEIPVVVISGQAATLATPARLGFDGYLQKPIGIQTLLQRIEQVGRASPALSREGDTRKEQN